MDFRIPCPCGNQVTVTEAAADGTARCPCGRELSVPSWRELRLQAGLPPYSISPEKMIEHLLLAGQLPGTRACSKCGTPTDSTIPVSADCERRWTQQPGCFSTVVVFVLAPIWLFILWWWREKDQARSYGEDKVFKLPLPICALCDPKVRGQKVLKQCMSAIPVYRELLEKFPEAKVTR
jgi:hypothetical protein